MKGVRKKTNEGCLGGIDWVSPENTYIFDCAINLIGEKLASLQCFQNQEQLLLFGMKADSAVFLRFRCLSTSLVSIMSSFRSFHE